MAGAFGLEERLRAWTYRQQLLGRAGAEPLAALRQVVAVYSNHPTAPLALLARCRAFAPPDLPELERQRAMVRLAAMRGTVFLLPAETAGRIFAAARPSLAGTERRLRDLGYTPEEFARLQERVRTTLREPLLPRELPGVLGDGDAADEARIATGVRIMAYAGLVLRVGSHLRTNTLRYVSTEGWLGRPLEDMDQAEALRWLAGEYLRGYGPARVADFAWWTGASLGKARAALAGVATVDVGDGLLLPVDQGEEFARVESLDPEAIDLLPKWDSYTMGYAPDGRRRLLDDAHLKLAYSQGGGGTLPGDGFPLVLRGGRAVATWAHRFAGNRLRVTVAPFEAGGLAPAAVERAFAGVGELLSASAVEVEIGEK
jgi:hypothetical protein